MDITFRLKISSEEILLLSNTFTIMHILLIDNSEDDEDIVLEINNGSITLESNILPKWARPVVEQYKKD
ncbi:hypothetical protein [Virgibacillus oceani]|uniref:hypothetical protein n=1 Tax=Virgibacillus oceani TaxID=1479511 RepID=UPI001E647C88|nr:hypothetical protein [Virgibacillus oceani]